MPAETTWGTFCGDMAFTVELSRLSSPSAVAAKLIFLRDLLGVNLIVKFQGYSLTVDSLDDAVSLEARMTGGERRA